jgi:hypothetical protein
MVIKIDKTDVSMRHAVMVVQRPVWLYRWSTLHLDVEDLGRARDRHFPQDDSSLGRTIRPSMGQKMKEAVAPSLTCTAISMTWLC